MPRKYVVLGDGQCVFASSVELGSLSKPVWLTPLTAVIRLTSSSVGAP